MSVIIFCPHCTALGGSSGSCRGWGGCKDVVWDGGQGGGLGGGSVVVEEVLGGTMKNKTLDLAISNADAP